MDCIFKTYGIVPKNHLCTNCAPIEQIFQSTGLNPKQAKKATKQTLIAYRLLKLQDKIRDEPDPKKNSCKNTMHTTLNPDNKTNKTSNK